jgi:DNA polymerase III alpha subunit
MLNLKDRIVDDYGTVAFTDEGLISLLYKGDVVLSDIVAVDSVDVGKHNQFSKLFDIKEDILKIYKEPIIDKNEFNSSLRANWFVPDEYTQINALEYLLNLCTSSVEEERVKHEYVLYEKYQMIDVLKFLIYFIDTLRKNNILWGVGRGSSCASYCLYLIGAHKVNSIKYDLDVLEFLKDNMGA